VSYDNSLVVSITVTCNSWAPSSGDHLFTCGAIYLLPQARGDSKPKTCQHNLLIRIQTACCAAERIKAISPSIVQMRRLLHFVHVQCAVQVAYK